MEKGKQMSGSTDKNEEEVDEFLEDLKNLLNKRGYSFHKRSEDDWYFKKDDQDWSNGKARFETEEDMVYDAIQNYILRIEKVKRSVSQRYREAINRD